MDVSKIETGQILDWISKWETETIKLNKMILNDASKEFDSASKIGFGIDGDQTVTDIDFEAVRGLPEDNKFIIGIHNEIKQTEAKASELRNIFQ